MERGPFPIVEFDPEREALIEPSRVIAPRDVPACSVPCFFLEVIEKVTAEQHARVVVENGWENGSHPIYGGNDGRRPVPGRALRPARMTPLVQPVHRRQRG